MSMARRMRSGTGVGPGIWRKCRPARRGALDMDLPAHLTEACRIMSYRGSVPRSSDQLAPEPPTLARWIRATDTRMPITPTNHVLAERLRKELAGEVHFDRFSRGRYSTDASHYQIEPVGVVVPRTQEDVIAAMAIAREEGVPVLPRGGGTTQSGQTVGRALVLDFSKYLNRLVA